MGVTAPLAGAHQSRVYNCEGHPLDIWSMLNADLEVVGDCRHRRELEAAGVGPSALRMAGGDGMSANGRSRVPIPKGHARCVRVGCDAVFNVEADTSTAGASCCVHHPGPVSFRDGVKTWVCCEAYSRDFDLFLRIPGCASAARHAAEGDESVAPLQIQSLTPSGTDLVPAAGELSDADVARIAERAAEKIKEKGVDHRDSRDPWAVLGLVGRPGTGAIDIARRVFTCLVHALHPEAGGPRASARAFLTAQAAWEAISRP